MYLGFRRLSAARPPVGGARRSSFVPLGRTERGPRTQSAAGLSVRELSGRPSAEYYGVTQLPPAETSASLWSEARRGAAREAAARIASRA